MALKIDVHLPRQPIENRPVLSERILGTIRPSWFSWSGWGTGALQREIEALSPEALRKELEAVLQEENGMAAIDKLAELIPLEKLQDAVRTAYPEHVDAFQKARSMFAQAKYYFEQTEHRISPTLKTRISSLLDSILSVLESIINAFGLTEFFKPAENGIDADYKGSKIMMLLSLFSMLTTMLVPLFGAEKIGLIIGSTLLTIVTLSLIYPTIKRRPVSLPKAENWSLQAREGSLKAAEGRKETLDAMARTLIASKEVKKHVMLIGQTGVGKTETARAFIHALERGDYPELQGKEAFYINTEDLVSNTEMFSRGNRILSRYSEVMGRHREDIILIFDEIHRACEKKEDSAMSEQLKTYLDQKKDNFPYVIGITTEEEYYREIYAKNPAFARRFKPIVIENTTRPETLEIINNTFLKSAPKVLVDPKIAERLLQKVTEAFGDNAAQPATVIQILSQCIVKTAESQKSPLEKRIQQLSTEIRSKNSQGAVGQGAGFIEYGNQEDDLETQLGKLEEEFQQQKTEIEAFYKMRDRLAEAKKETLRTVLKVNHATRKDLGRFLLLSHFVAPALETKVRSEADQLKLNTLINDALIDEVIREEQENNRKAQQMVQQGREQIASRV